MLATSPSSRKVLQALGAHSGVLSPNDLKQSHADGGIKRSSPMFS